MPAKPNGMFGPLASATNPDLQRKIMALQLQQKMADEVLSRGMEQGDPARMAGRYVIPTSGTEGISKLLQTVIGLNMKNKAMDSESELNKDVMAQQLKLFGGGDQQVGQPQRSFRDPGMSAGPQSQPRSYGDPGMSAGEQSRGPLQMEGLSPDQAYLYYSSNPEAYISELMKRTDNRTEFTKELMNAGVTPNDPRWQRAMQGKLAKELHMPLETVGEGSTALDPLTRQPVFTGPKDGQMVAWGAQGPASYQIPGAIGNEAARAGAIKGAQEDASIFTNQTVNGRESVPVTGAMIRAGQYGAPQSSTAGYPASPEISGAQTAPISPQFGITAQHKQETTTRGTNLANIENKIDETARDATALNLKLNQIQELATHFDASKAAPLKKAITEWAYAMGVDVDQKAIESASSITALDGIATELAAKATRQGDSNPTEFQFRKMLEVNPGAAMLPQGLQKLIILGKFNNDLNISKQQEKEAYKRINGGSLDGFESSWNKKVNESPVPSTGQSSGFKYLGKE